MDIAKTQCEVVHPVSEWRCVHPNGQDHKGKHRSYILGEKDWSESYLTIHNIRHFGTLDNKG